MRCVSATPYAPLPRLSPHYATAGQLHMPLSSESLSLARLPELCALTHELHGAHSLWFKVFVITKLLLRMHDDAVRLI